MKEFRANGKKPTHVLMNGGTLHITPDRLNEFNQAYCQSIRKGERLFVVEQKTPMYRLFIDIDYVDEEALTYETIKSISRMLTDKVRSLVGDNKDMCIISVAKPKPKGVLTKTGIHLNWPLCVVGQKEALCVRDHLISHMSKIYSAKDWSYIIDKAVFGDLQTGSIGSGFRLPWSYKKTRDVVEGPYIPFFEYKNGNIIDITDEQISIERLEQVQIRTTEEEPNITVESVGPFSLHPPSRKLQGKEIDNPEVSAYMETFIRINMKGQGDSRIQKFIRNKDTYAIQTNSKFCENVGRNHSSNHVWFFVSKKTSTVCQKCFCTCETSNGRRYGFCRDFSGQTHGLPNKIMYLLFPEKDEEDKKDKQWLKNKSIKRRI